MPCGWNNSKTSRHDSIVDFKKGYWIVVLHPESRKLTCMVLPFGRFQWTRLPKGTVVAQDIFQSKLDSIFIGMEGVTGIADDKVIAGRDEMEHDRNFLAFMEKCMSNNLTLNLEKIQFKQSQVSFYGHCWSKHGISPDPKKDQGIESYGIPTRQGNYEIFPRDDQLPQQVQCTQCTPRSIPQCTHTSSHELLTR